jgi:hypothetical protein
MKRQYLLIALGLAVFGIILRLLPHPDNFAPLTALAIFSGSILPRRYGAWVALAAAIISDAFIGFYSIMPIVWACYLIMALASNRWLKKPSFLSGFGFTVAASTFFFIVTNLAVWLFGNMYAHTFAGLIQCYALAIPFFRNSLLGDLTYVASLFCFLALVRVLAAPKINKDSYASESRS